MRNRCVEISLLDSPAAIAVAPVTASPDGDGAIATLTENSTDLLSVVRASGITGSREATAALAVHSALVSRRCKGKGGVSSGEGPTPRSLQLWADLSNSARSRASKRDPLKESLCLAYPAVSVGGGRVSLAEGKVAEAALSACLDASDGDGLQRGSKLLEILSTCAWDQVVRHGVSSQIDQDLTVLRILVAVAASGLGDASRRLLHVVVQAVASNNAPGVNSESRPPAVGSSDLSLTAEDEVFIFPVCSLAEANGNLTTKLQLRAAAFFAQRACVGDHRLRSMVADRLSALGGASELGLSSANVGEAVAAMIKALFNSPGWADVSTLLEDISSGFPKGVSAGARGG